MAGHRVASEADIEEGSVRLFEVAGREVAVAKSEGSIYAFDDLCTHAGCSLSDGEISGRTVICACHSGVFDIATGEVIDGPPPEPVETYPVTVTDGEVFITVED